MKPFTFITERVILLAEQTARELQIKRPNVVMDLTVEVGHKTMWLRNLKSMTVDEKSIVVTYGAPEPETETLPIDRIWRYDAQVRTMAAYQAEEMIAAGIL